MWHTLLIGLLTAAAAYKITFPQIDDFEMDCTISDGTKGVCRGVKACPTAFTGKTDPLTCRFEQFEQFICCKDELAENLIKQNDAVCMEYNPMRLAVTHGMPTRPMEFPFMVALGWETTQKNLYDFKCGGALITNAFVLTAAHCVHREGYRPTVVLPGGFNTTDRTTEIYHIEEIFLHPEYKSYNMYHDIALIKLKTPISWHNGACLWRSFELIDHNVTVMGYGDTSFGGTPSPQLLKAHLLVMSNKQCREHFKGIRNLPNGIIDKQLCAIDPALQRDSCQGDSGGPLIMHYSAGVYVVGITSFGRGCAGGAPGVYTRVSEYYQWIDQILQVNPSSAEVRPSKIQLHLNADEDKDIFL